MPERPSLEAQIDDDEAWPANANRSLYQKETNTL